MRQFFNLEALESDLKRLIDSNPDLIGRKFEEVAGIGGLCELDLLDLAVMVEDLRLLDGEEIFGLPVAALLFFIVCHEEVLAQYSDWPVERGFRQPDILQ